MRSDKWNISWQVARVRVKRIKDVREKVEFMQEWLHRFNYYPNVDRIRNWLRMSIMSANSKTGEIYKEALTNLEHYAKHHQFESGDMNNDIYEFETYQIADVLKDLESRTYGFQFKKPPKAHITFVERLQHALR